MSKVAITFCVPRWHGDFDFAQLHDVEEGKTAELACASVLTSYSDGEWLSAAGLFCIRGQWPVLLKS